jgi:hypothetical protein
MNSIKRILLAAIVMAAFTMVQADKMDCDTGMMKIMKPTHEFGYVSPGSAWLTLGKVNSLLNSQGLSGFPEQAWTLSFGHYEDFRRLVMESELTLRIWGDNVNAGLRTSLFTGDITWNSGFNVLPPEWAASLYPYLGLGIGLNSLYFRENSRTLAELRVSTEPNSNAWELTPLLNLGLGSNFLFANNDRSKGLVVGLRAGYLVDLYYTKRWMSDGIYVSDLPSISQTGPYVRLVLGAWGKHHHHHIERHEE